MKRLGIDLGTSSLGWAIIDDDRMEAAPTGSEAPSPIDCGVVIFPEGMDRDKSDNLSSPAAERRQKRAARRLIARRRLRKFHMLRALMELGMCPLSEAGFDSWKRNHVYPIHDEAFMAWLAATPTHNPYADRAAAASIPVDKLTLGRALYHMAQRRGFKSSRKERLQELEAAAADGSNEAKKAASASEATQTKQEIDRLTAALEKENLTLGQYFYRLFQKNCTNTALAERIRGRRTGRIEHYEKEFNVIAKTQGLSEAVATRLRNILFFQRPLRIQRHTVGWCALEKGYIYTDENGKKKTGHHYRRCLESHPAFEKFRAYAFLNNLKISSEEPKSGDRLGKDEGRALTAEEKEALFKALTRKTPCKVKDLLKPLAKACKAKTLYSNYRPTDDAPVMPVRAAFTELGLAEAQWQTALNALIDFDDVDKLIAWAQKRFNFSPEDANRFVRINPSEERASYSLHAINKILPYLVDRNYTLAKAIFCANLGTVLKETFEANKEQILADLEACDEAYDSDKASRTDTRARLVGRKERYKLRLTNDWGLTEAGWKQLYVDDIETNKEDPVLPPVDLGSIRNPIVCRSLTVLRRLVNTLRRNGKIDADTQIAIELAKNVNNANQCRAIEKWQITQRTKRADAVAELELLTKGKRQITDTLILRYLLWKEQDEICPYTGQTISISQMLDECDIEHTVPRARGGTNKQENLTLCHPDYNRSVKKKCLPSECPNYNDHHGKFPPILQSRPISKWKEELKTLEKNLQKKPRKGSDPAIYAAARQKWLIMQIDRNYLKAKLRTFELTREQIEHDSFMPRQLVDTGIMTTQAIRFLKTRYDKVYSRNGAATAAARKAWGLQKDDEKKSRIDHVHHAVDACVIAALDTASFQAICTELGKDTTHDYEAVCPPPYPDFATKVNRATESILVRHLPKNRQENPIYKRTAHIPQAVINRLHREGKPLPKPTQSTDAVRGSLHNDTIYGRVNFQGETVTVLRKTIADAAEKKDLIKIAEAAVDKAVREALLEQIKTYSEKGIEGKQIPRMAYTLPSGMPIKSVRIRVSKPANPDPIRQQAFDPQQAVYGSGSDALRFDITRDKKGNCVPNYTTLLDITNGNSTTEDILYTIYPMQLALVYDKAPEELKTLSHEDLAKRLYWVRQVKGSGNKLVLYHHREARPKVILEKDLLSQGKKKDGASKINFETPEPLLLISSSTFFNHLLFENVHFRLGLDGSIEWLD